MVHGVRIEGHARFHEWHPLQHGRRGTGAVVAAGRSYREGKRDGRILCLHSRKPQAAGGYQSGRYGGSDGDSGPGGHLPEKIRYVAGTRRFRLAVEPAWRHVIGGRSSIRRITTIENTFARTLKHE